MCRKTFRNLERKQKQGHIVCVSVNGGENGASGQRDHWGVGVVEEAEEKRIGLWEHSQQLRTKAMFFDQKVH